MASVDYPEENPNHLDLSSDPPPLPKPLPEVLPQSPSIREATRRRRGTNRSVRFYFGCCRVYATLIPPEHVMRGDSDLWRAHCPRCGGLVEIVFQ
jgi:hypothetical protein